MKPQGVVHRWVAERGFGFIRPDNGGHDLFVHLRAISNVDGDEVDVGSRIVDEAKPKLRIIESDLRWFERPIGMQGLRAIPALGWSAVAEATSLCPRGWPSRKWMVHHRALARAARSRSEVLEFSIVPIPANADCLIEGISGGAKAMTNKQRRYARELDVIRLRSAP